MPQGTDLGGLGGFFSSVHMDTVVITWIIIALSTLAFSRLRRGLRSSPGIFQSLLEMVVDYFTDLARTLAGPEGARFIPLVLSVFTFVLLSNWIGLIPSFRIGHLVLFMPPTRDINTTAALALVSFLSFHFFGILSRKWKYIAHYIEPLPTVMKDLPKSIVFRLLMVPFLGLLFIVLNLVEELARVLSLSVRLFGNIVGEHIVSAALIMFVGIVLELLLLAGPLVDILPLFVLMLGLVTGAVQAFIFAILTLSYIAHAVREHH